MHMLKLILSLQKFCLINSLISQSYAKWISLLLNSNKSCKKSLKLHWLMHFLSPSKSTLAIFSKISSTFLLLPSSSILSLLYYNIKKVLLLSSRISMQSFVNNTNLGVSFFLLNNKEIAPLHLTKCALLLLYTFDSAKE